jgi:hypothetical protein
MNAIVLVNLEKERIRSIYSYSMLGDTNCSFVTGIDSRYFLKLFFFCLHHGRWIRFFYFVLTISPDDNI